MTITMNLDAEAARAYGPTLGDNVVAIDREISTPAASAKVSAKDPKTERLVVGIAFIGQRNSEEKLREALQSLVGSAAPFVRERGGVVAGIRRIREPGKVQAAAETTRKALVAATGDSTITVGLVGPRKSTTDPHLLLLHAEQTVLLGRSLNGPGSVTWFDDLGSLRFIVGQAPEDIRRFTQDTLGKLAMGKPSNNCRPGELILTLDSYLNARGNLNEVARELFLHRNTVRQRLRRITELTHTDLSDPKNYLTLHLALIARRALVALDPESEPGTNPPRRRTRRRVDPVKVA